MKKNLLYTFLLAALATSCTDDSFLKHGGSNEAGGSGNGSRVYIQNFMQEPDSVDVQGLLTRGVAETTPDANGICQAEWFTTKEEEIDIYELGDDDKFTYFTTAKLHPDSQIDNHSWAGYDSWFGETMDYVDYKPGHKYVAVCGTKAILNYNRDTFDPYNPTLNMAGQRSCPQDNETVNLDYDFMVSNLVEAGKVEKGVMSSQPDFYFNHVASLVKYNLYNLPADKKITKIIVSSPASSFLLEDGSGVHELPLGFHVIAPFSFIWDTAHPNEVNCMPNITMDYWTSATAPLEITICDENETVGRTPSAVPGDDKYADYNTKLTASFFATYAIFNDGQTRRTDALVVRAIAEDGSSYVCVTSEDGDAYNLQTAYVRNIVMRPDNVTLAQTRGFVDLGLPSGTLWDAVNFGANSPEESGDYYAWGEVKTKDTYTPYNYTLYDKYSYSDSQIVLESEDDVCQALNPKISLPTQEQIRELVFKCRWQQVYYKGTVGSLVTGPNGNQIFIPYAGYKYDGSTMYQSAQGYLWSKSLEGFNNNDESLAGVLRVFGDGKRNNYSMDRYYGLPVRCVAKEYKEPDFNGHDYVDLGLPSRTLWATMNVGATEVAGSKIHPLTGLQDCYGQFYAWGETTGLGEAPKYEVGDGSYSGYRSLDVKESFSISNYKWSNDEGDAYGANKYKGPFKLKDDAAHVNMGGDWIMPTKSMFNELILNVCCIKTSNYNGTGIGGFILYKPKFVNDKNKTFAENENTTYSLSDVHLFLPYFSGTSNGILAGGYLVNDVGDGTGVSRYTYYLTTMFGTLSMRNDGYKWGGHAARACIQSYYNK